MKPGARDVLALVALCAFGCFGHRLERNAPGHVDLAAPPPDPSSREPVEPEDPGDQSVILAAGGFASGGAAFGGVLGGRGAYGLGLEVRAQHAWYDRTVLMPFLPGLPDRALGVNFGWTPLLEGGQPGRLHLELQGRLRPVYGLALGWAWEPNGVGQGPQATASLGPLFLRGSYLRARGTSIQLGIALEPSFELLWSR